MELTNCAVIGHRPTRFKWKYKENNTGCKRLKKRLHDVFIQLYSCGVRVFYVGGSLGVDQWAGEILLDLKKQEPYKDIQLIVALPFEGHDERWDERSRRRLNYLKQNSKCITIGTEPGPESYKTRNAYLLNQVDCLVAVYDNDRTVQSGTGLTVSTAEGKGLPIVLIHPDSGKTSYMGAWGKTQ